MIDAKGIVKTIRISEIIDLLDAKIVCGCMNDQSIEYAFASDLMSDVLTLDAENLLLITGLSNLQAIRTAEMSDITHILFVRNKTVTEDMIKLANELNLTLLQCPWSMFKASGILYGAGLKPVF